jgi:hypothetical protein
MSRLAIMFGLAVATAANAQDAPSGKSPSPAGTSPNATKPFLFDGRMKGDGVPRGAHVTIDTPMRAPSSRNRKRASLRASDESAAHPLIGAMVLALAIVAAFQSFS